MSNKTLVFRKNYRENISDRYSGVLHVGFVFVAGLIFLLACVINLDSSITLGHFMMLVLGLCLFNAGEYFLHKHLGHKKIVALKRVGKLFYQRHTGDHHSFFDHLHMAFNDKRDWRVVFFPAWLVVVIIIIALFTGYFLNLWLSLNSAKMFMIGVVGGYLLYEFLHYTYHLPTDHWMIKLPWIKQMRHLHAIHHHSAYMTSKNFNLTFPLMDVVMRTYYWVSEEELQSMK